MTGGIKRGVHQLPTAARRPCSGPRGLLAAFEVVAGERDLGLPGCLVAIIESAVGRAVAVDPEIADVTGHLKIIRPVEVKADGVPAQPKISAGDAKHQLVAANFVRNAADRRRPTPTIGRRGIAAERRRRSPHAAEADGVIVPFPAGGVILVGVEEQHHPVAAGGSGDVRVALGEKVEVGDVARYFQHGKIIAAGEVGVTTILGDGGGKVAPDRVIGGVKERPRHVGPIAEVAPQIDALRCTGGRSCADALAQAILGGHLEVIRIRVTAAHRLYIAAVLGRVLVNKVEPI